MSLTLCVCLWGVNLFSSKFSNHMMLDVKSLLQCYKGVSWVSQWCFKGALGGPKFAPRVLEECSKGVPRVFKRCFEGV